MVKKYNVNKKMAFLLVGLFILMGVSLVSAYGVATPYWDTYPLKLSPGESFVVELALQNMVGGGDLSFTAEIIDDGNGIASLVDGVDKVYEVPFGIDNVPVLVNVVVPGDILQGDTREVVLSFSQVGVETEGTVTILGGFTSKFIVEIVTETQSVLFEPEVKEVIATKGTSYFWYIGGAIVVILLIILFVIFKKRKDGDKDLTLRGAEILKKGR